MPTCRAARARPGCAVTVHGRRTRTGWSRPRSVCARRRTKQPKQPEPQPQPDPDHSRRPDPWGDDGGYDDGGSYDDGGGYDDGSGYDEGSGYDGDGGYDDATDDSDSYQESGNTADGSEVWVDRRGNRYTVEYVRGRRGRTFVILHPVR